MQFSFFDYEVNTLLFEITKSGEKLQVEPKVFDLIVYLISHRERLISRNELFEQVWKGREVSDTSLSNHIKTARKILGDSNESQHVIKTSRGRGYQFIADTTVISKSRTHPQPKFIPQLIYKILSIFSIVGILTFIFLNEANNTSSKASINNIAVMPFKNIKPNDEYNYLGFAIADQVIGQLHPFQQFTVRSSGSIQQYQHSVVSPKEIGEKLQVNYVVMGNYIIENDHIRLTMELIDTGTEQLLWREDIKDSIDNLFHLQDVIAQTISDHFKVRFSQKAYSDSAFEQPENQIAYNQFLRAIAQPQTNEGAKEAIRLLKMAIDIDPNFSSYYAELGNRVKFLAVFGLQGHARKEQAIGHYNQALLLNPSSRIAKIGLANFYVEIGEVEQAIALLNELIHQNPKDAQAHYSLGYLLRYSGMLNESIAEISTAINIESHDRWHHNLGLAYMGLGRYDEALASLNVGEKTPYSLGWIAGIYILQNKNEAALEVLNQVITMEPGSFWELDSVASKSIINNEKEVGVAALKALEEIDLSDSEPNFYWAGIYAMLGEKEHAIRLLTKAVKFGYYNYPYFQNNKMLDPIRNTPEFQKIMSSVKAKHEVFKAQYKKIKSA